MVARISSSFADSNPFRKNVEAVSVVEEARQDSFPKIV